MHSTSEKRVREVRHICFLVGNLSNEVFHDIATGGDVRKPVPNRSHPNSVKIELFDFHSSRKKRVVC
jgi:hypothetical protein